MKNNYDAIIIGAGHNGLVAAASLAKAGKKVLVLEQRDNLGGAAATEELFPGFKVNSGSNDAGLFQNEITKALSLSSHGLEFSDSPVLLFAPQLDGSSLTLYQDVEKSVKEIAKFSQKDAQQYPEFVAKVGRMAKVLQQMMLVRSPDLLNRPLSDMAAWGKIALKVKGLGKRDMMEFVRVLPMPASEFLDEYFESDVLKGALGASSVTGTMQGPRSGGTALIMLYQAADGSGRVRASRFVRGGIGQLSSSLATAAKAKGAEIRTGAAVERILLDDGKATGVALANGEQIAAKIVLSNADPRRTLLGMVGPTNLDPYFMRDVRNIIYRGTTAQMHLALSGLPKFNGQSDDTQLGGHILVNPSLTYTERAYDDAKYGRISANPFLDIVIPTVLDNSLAPKGQHVMSITMRYAPYKLRGTNWKAERAGLAEKILDLVAQYAPGIKELILHQQLLTPLDWEQSYGLTEGSIFHGQMGLDQLLVGRPVSKWNQYRTPIEGLYLCGAGTHPGGGVTGAPGYNAAKEALKAL